MHFQRWVHSAGERSLDDYWTFIAATAILSTSFANKSDKLIIVSALRWVAWIIPDGISYMCISGNDIRNDSHSSVAWSAKNNKINYVHLHLLRVSTRFETRCNCSPVLTHLGSVSTLILFIHSLTRAFSCFHGWRLTSHTHTHTAHKRYIISFIFNSIRAQIINSNSNYPARHSVILISIQTNNWNTYLLNFISVKTFKIIYSFFVVRRMLSCG